MIGSVTSVCTECAVNRHGLCEWWALDYATDQWQECPCWCRTVQDRTHSQRPRGSLAGRVLDVLDAWLGPRDPATRCPWTTPGNGPQCDRKTGHKRLCRTFEDGRTQHWLGINYPKGGLP